MTNFPIEQSVLRASAVAAVASEPAYTSHVVGVNSMQQYPDSGLIQKPINNNNMRHYKLQRTRSQLLVGNPNVSPDTDTIIHLSQHATTLQTIALNCSCLSSKILETSLLTCHIWIITTKLCYLNKCR